MSLKTSKGFAMIRSEIQDQIFEIVLDRPEKRNAIQLSMLEEIAAAVIEAQQQDHIRLVVIRGEGTAFSAGLDLNGMGGIMERFGANWAQRPHAVTRAWQSPLNTLANSPIPTLALIHGYCLGAGLEIALACDFRYATPDAQLSLAETRIGLIPDVGGTTRLIYTVGIPRAKAMIYTARRLDGIIAAEWGLVDKVVDAEALSDSARELAAELAQTAPLAVSASKRVIQGIADEARGLYLEAIEQAALFQTDDLQEGMLSVMEKRPAQWKNS